MGFNPVLWLATYLKKYAASPSLCPLTPSSFNPNVPPRFTFIQAVVYLQARVRSYLVWSHGSNPLSHVGRLARSSSVARRSRCASESKRSRHASCSA